MTPANSSRTDFTQNTNDLSCVQVSETSPPPVTPTLSHSVPSLPVLHSDLSTAHASLAVKSVNDSFYLTPSFSVHPKLVYSLYYTEVKNFFLRGQKQNSCLILHPPSLRFPPFPTLSRRESPVTLQVGYHWTWFYVFTSTTLHRLINCIKFSFSVFIFIFPPTVRDNGFQKLDTSFLVSPVTDSTVQTSFPSNSHLWPFFSSPL